MVVVRVVVQRLQANKGGKSRTVNGSGPGMKGTSVIGSVLSFGHEGSSMGATDPHGWAVCSASFTLLAALSRS